MPLETGTFVNDLTPANPLSSDPAGQGDDHLRLIKSTVLATFPQMGSVLHQTRQVDTNTSLLALWNTNRIRATGSATATISMALPASASITAGWSLDLNTTDTTAVLTPASGSINGTSTMAVPPFSVARVTYEGASAWRVVSTPNMLGGQLPFPATQNPSTDPNTLDDYEEGSWTPILSFVTPGTSVITHVLQIGRYTKVGNLISISFELTTSTFTAGTASGNLQISGLPFAVATHTATLSGIIGGHNNDSAGGAGTNVLNWQALTGASALNLVNTNNTTGSSLIISVATTGIGTAANKLYRCTGNYRS